MWAFSEVLRPANCLMAAAAVPLGAAVASGAGLGPDVLPAAATVFLICGAGNVVNDYYDRDIDAVNAPERPIPSGRLSPQGAQAYAIVLFLAGVGLAATINTLALTIALLAAVLLAAYAHSGKRMGIWGNLIVSLLVGLTIVYGGVAVAADNTAALRRVGVLGMCALLANLGRELVKDIEDLEGDLTEDARSVPAVHGPEHARTLATTALAAAIVLGFLPLYLGFFTSTYYIGAILIADAMFATAAVQLFQGELTSDSAGRSQRIIKFGMFCALIAFLVGNR